MIPAYLLLLLIDDSGLYSGIEVGEVAVEYVAPQLTIYRMNAGTLNVSRSNAGTLTIQRPHAGILEVHQ